MAMIEERGYGHLYLFTFLANNSLQITQFTESALSEGELLEVPIWNT
jgi:hypothetical protein